MKKFKVGIEAISFKTFLTEKGIKWEVADNWIGVIVHVYCATDLVNLGIEFWRQLEAIEGRQGPSYDMAGKLIIL